MQTSQIAREYRRGMPIKSIDGMNLEQLLELVLDDGEFATWEGDRIDPLWIDAIREAVEVEAARRFYPVNEVEIYRKKAQLWDALIKNYVDHQIKAARDE